MNNSNFGYMSIESAIFAVFNLFFFCLTVVTAIIVIIAMIRFWKQKRFFNEFVILSLVNGLISTIIIISLSIIIMYLTDFFEAGGFYILGTILIIPPVISWLLNSRLSANNSFLFKLATSYPVVIPLTFIAFEIAITFGPTNQTFILQRP